MIFCPVCRRVPYSTGVIYRLGGSSDPIYACPCTRTSVRVREYPSWKPRSLSMLVEIEAVVLRTVPGDPSDVLEDAHWWRYRWGLTSTFSAVAWGRGYGAWLFEPGEGAVRVPPSRVARAVRRVARPATADHAVASVMGS